MKSIKEFKLFQPFLEILTHFFFSSFPASQNNMANLSQSISPSSTESASFTPNVSSKSDNISVGVTLTPSPVLPLSTTASVLAKGSSEGGLFSSSSSSVLSQNASSSMSEWLTFFL